MPTRTEKIIAYIMLASMMICFVSLSFTVWAGRGNLSQYAYLGIVGLICSWIVLIITSIVYRVRAAKMNKARAAARSHYNEEAVNLPDFTIANSSNVILKLGWSTEVNNFFRLNILCLAYNRKAWIWAASYGIFIGVCAAFAFGPGSILAIVLSFCGGVLLYAYGAYSLVRQRLRLISQYNSSVWHSAVIVEGEGLREIIGKTTSIFPWASVKNVNEFGGTVIYTRDGLPNMIPHYAFQSRADSKAFVATINAMKAGNAPPQHDWSMYTDLGLSTEGVWPPPIQ